MSRHTNEFGQPIGTPLHDWVPPAHPPRAPLEGRLCRLEPLDAERHADGLFTSFAQHADGRSWTYMGYGPFSSSDNYRAWICHHCLADDPLYFAICLGADMTPVGVASYLRITPAGGTIEVGHIMFSPALQRTAAGTEAMFLMMQQAFTLGYRRYEWKCDALNDASRAAARRLGFSFEGIFRQATVYKGRSRDTAWYAVIDADWPTLQAAFLKWLEPDNFDAQGKQRVRLADLTRPILKYWG